MAWKNNSRQPHHSSNTETPWYVKRLLEVIEETNQFINENLDENLSLVGSEMQVGPNFRCAKAQLMDNGQPIGPVVKMTMIDKLTDRRGRDVQIIGLEINGNDHYTAADPFAISAIINQYADIDMASEPEGANLVGADT